MAFCAFGSAGDAYVFVSGPHQPTEYEWNAYLADLARFSDEPFGLLVLADRGLPDMRPKLPPSRSWPTRRSTA